jgi:hypothetical protein
LRRSVLWETKYLFTSFHAIWDTAIWFQSHEGDRSLRKAGSQLQHAEGRNKKKREGRVKIEETWHPYTRRRNRKKKKINSLR